MISAKQLVYGLSLIGIAAMAPLRAAVEYVAPEQSIPRGKAPKMQVKLLNPGETIK